MPSEIIVPGAAVTLVFLIAASLFIGTLMYSATLLHSSLRNYVDSLAKSKLNKVVIVNATLVNIRNAGNGVYEVEFKINVYNEGPDPIYAMDKCDLIVQYYTIIGKIKAIKLKYEASWNVEEVVLAENYSVPFSSKPAIGPSEVGVIRGVFIADDVDIKKPVKLVFTSQYGFTATRWAIYGS